MSGREGICDGCGVFGPRVRGVCAMCRVDGVELRETGAERDARILSETRAICGGPPDNFGTIKRERARVAAIRAEHAAEERRGLERAIAEGGR